MRALSTKLKLSAAGLLVAVGSFFAINQVMSDVDAVTRDCSSNAVITCGVLSVSEMRNKYNNDNPRGTKNIFAGMGISSNVVNNYTVKEGMVYGNGNVTVDGKVVATGAHSSGREKMVGGTERNYGGTRYFERPVGLWNIHSWPSYVFVDKNGTFVGAVMKSCGNPVKANPVKPPEPPKPVYRCASLSRIKQDDPTKYVFRGKSASENGAKPTGFTFDFGDGNSQRVAVQRTEGKYAFADAPHTYTRSGTYNVKVTAHFTVNGKNVSATSDNCQKPVTIKVPKPEPTPKNPDVSIVKKVSATKHHTDDNDSGMTKEEALEQARNFKPTGNCTTVMTPAVHVETGATYTFPSGCLPAGWVRSDRANQPAARTTNATTESSAEWVDHTTVAAGVDFQYRLVITNTGDVTLKNVKVTDPAPTGITFKSADKGTVAGNAWSWTIPELKVNQSVTVIITAQVDRATGEVIKNTACVDAPAIPGDKDDCDDATVDTKKPTPTPPAPEPEKPAPEPEKPAPTKPVVKEEVTELPQTGLAEALSGIGGLGALTTASYYYVMSRRNG